MKRALQQFAIRSAMKNEKRAAEVLAEAAAAGYEGIEICGFLTRKIPLIVRGFAAMAGMPIGACCKLDWHRLISDSGLAVVSVQHFFFPVFSTFFVPVFINSFLGFFHII